jgi:hypothetical protein
MAASVESRRGPEPEVRPRYGRITAAGVAAMVTLVTALGGLGVLPSGSAAAAPGATTTPSHTAPATSSAQPGASATPSPTSSAAASAPGTPTPSGGMWLASSDEQGPAAADTSASDLPADSGSGRRVVFAMSDQRVWLVDPHAGHDAVDRTYLVSGSVTDNLQPGTYAVYSKSLHAVGIEDSGTMEYMVRFAHGPHAAIGFHDIPVSHGALVQTRAELGTPRSHGCIRQWRPDAKALWRFAPVGTKVVVVA